MIINDSMQYHGLCFLASSNACTSLSSSLTNVRLIKVKSTVGYWAIEAAANFEAVSPAESEMTKIVTHFFLQK